MFSLNNTIPVCWNETATFTRVVGFIGILVVFPFYSLSLAHLVYLLILCVFLCVLSVYRTDVCLGRDTAVKHI